MRGFRHPDLAGTSAAASVTNQPELGAPATDAEADVDVDGEDDGDVEGDVEGEDDGDGDVEGEDDGDGEGEDDGDGDVEGEDEGDADGDAEGDADADGEDELEDDEGDADADADADVGPEAGADGIRNEDASGPCSVDGVTRAACAECACRTGAELPDPRAAELGINGACDVASGSATTVPVCVSP